MDVLPSYQLKRYKRSKSIRISIKPNGLVLVTAPHGVPKAKVDTFVQHSRDWILYKLKVVTLRQDSGEFLNFSTKCVFYLGKKYQFQMGNLPVRVEQQGTIFIVSPITILASDVPKTLCNWLKKQSRQIISDLVVEWSKNMGVSYSRIRFGQQSSRWGSCSTSGTLSFNWRLVHFPVKVIEYVVIHELAHVTHQNHGQEYWNLVETHCPNYRKLRSKLKRQVVIPVEC